MVKKLTAMFLSTAVLFALPLTGALAQDGWCGHAEPGRKEAPVHPEKQTKAVAVHTTKPKPVPKAEKIPKATRANTSWVPGDYYWTAMTGNGLAATGLISHGRTSFGFPATGATASGAGPGFRILALSGSRRAGNRGPCGPRHRVSCASGCASRRVTPVAVAAVSDGAGVQRQGLPLSAFAHKPLLDFCVRS